MKERGKKKKIQKIIERSRDREKQEERERDKINKFASKQINR